MIRFQLLWPRTMTWCDSVVDSLARQCHTSYGYVIIAVIILYLPANPYCDRVLVGLNEQRKQRKLIPFFDVNEVP